MNTTSLAGGMLCSCLVLMAGQALAADITVNLSGIRAGGTLYVGIQTKDQFQTAATTSGKRDEEVSAGAHTYRLRDVAPGIYSLSVWHDINGNGAFDVSPQGLPRDGFAFVNGSALMGPPTWDQVSFEVNDDDFSISERVLYPAE